MNRDIEQAMFPSMRRQSFPRHFFLSFMTPRGGGEEARTEKGKDSREIDKKHT